jgi:hypothetical protein
MSTQQLSRGIVLAIAAAALAACGQADGGADPDAGADESSIDSQPRPDELAEHGGRPCPERLPGSGGGRVADPAPAPPALEEAGLAQPDRMWVCDYALIETRADPEGDASAPGWRLRIPALPVPEDQREALLEDVTTLEPADLGRMCTADTGPRRMLVFSTDGDLTGVVIDDFGCRDVRMTDDPHETVAGEASSPGTVPGVLTGPDGLSDRVEALVP